MLIIRNIGQLVLPGAHESPTGADSAIETIENAFIAVDGETVAEVGSDRDCNPPPDAEIIDAAGKCVVPGLIDCHTHTVFAGSREDEFVKRIQGKSYVKISEEGGGIKTSVEAVRNASVDELVALAVPRLRRMFAGGVTTVEIKSGYGLTVADEIKMLTAVRDLCDHVPMDIVATFLGAHTVPSEYQYRRSAYVDLVISDEMLGQIVEQELAEFCDIFTERTAFSVEESRKILLAAKERGLTPKLHADQITQIGASRLAAEVGAVSADHLETINAGGVTAMKDAGVVAVLLPGCSWFLGVDQAPARKLIDAGLTVAIATDYNPGSSMVESLPLCMAIACTQMKMTPAEVLRAATVSAAAALNRADRLGRIAPGYQADLVILDVDNLNQWPYNAGRNCVSTVIKKGMVVSQRND